MFDLSDDLEQAGIIGGGLFCTETYTCQDTYACTHTQGCRDTLMI